MVDKSRKSIKDTNVVRYDIEQSLMLSQHSNKVTDT